MSNDKKFEKSSKSTKSITQISSELHRLCKEQRAMANILSEMEMELNEHKIVINTLKSIDPKQKCYRMTRGVLCEHTVEVIMPALLANKEQLIKVIDTLNDQLTKKGIEIIEYREVHNIRIKGEHDVEQDKDVYSNEAKRITVVVNPLLSSYS